MLVEIFKKDEWNPQIFFKFLQSAIDFLDCTRSILLCVPLVEKLLECTLLSTDIQAGLKRSYQNFVSASITISSRKDFFVIRIASVELTRNPYALSLCSRPSHDTYVLSVAPTLHRERRESVSVCTLSLF